MTTTTDGNGDGGDGDARVEAMGRLLDRLTAGADQGMLLVHARRAIAESPALTLLSIELRIVDGKTGRMLLDDAEEAAALRAMPPVDIQALLASVHRALILGDRITATTERLGLSVETLTASVGGASRDFGLSPLAALSFVENVMVPIIQSAETDEAARKLVDDLHAMSDQIRATGALFDRMAEVCKAPPEPNAPTPWPQNLTVGGRHRSPSDPRSPRSVGGRGGRGRRGGRGGRNG